MLLHIEPEVKNILRALPLKEQTVMTQKAMVARR